MTRLFDFIHHHGCRIADKRAAKHEPGLAEREAARRTMPGVILGTEGPGGLDGLFDDLALADKYRPWWHAVTLHIHWWMEKHGPSATLATIRERRQRAKRGWSDRDTWSLDIHLATVIRDSVTHLRDNSHGHPVDLTEQEWDTILTEIADGMQAHLDNSSLFEHDVMLTRRDLAFDHLKARFGSLWD